jgi:hypothetical protein
LRFEFACIAKKRRKGTRDQEVNVKGSMKKMRNGKVYVKPEENVDDRECTLR